MVTDANINYEGSITISTDLMKLVGLCEYQKVLVVDINNGQRLRHMLLSQRIEMLYVLTELCREAGHCWRPGYYYGIWPC